VSAVSTSPSGPELAPPDDAAAAIGAAHPTGGERDLAAMARKAPTLWDDLITLTKPRIISLLLVTTVAPMYAAGSPTWWQVAVVLLGGYLMAGGANAVNMYLDRDIDDRMARTRLRPIPSGRMSATAVIAFGVAIATAATWLLAVTINPLTAGLALGGFYFYVFIYTRWLKRTSPQNIVIGGAAGAFPPLVGWAAMTNRVDLTAVILFAIVFYWTPPHFWALALLKQADYGRARVPMAPLVWGEAETKRQMTWYTVLLCGLTMLPFAYGEFGLVYFASALVLNALLLWGVVRVQRTPQWTGPAWWVYKYSLLYLALLFVAMAVDRRVGL
jgi:protoheme IX farnesyltransferase